MAGEAGNGPRIYKSFSIMSPSGGGGNQHQRLLAALLDPGAVLGRGALLAGTRDDGVPRIATWWEL